MSRASSTFHLAGCLKTQQSAAQLFSPEIISDKLKKTHKNGSRAKPMLLSEERGNVEAQEPASAHNRISSERVQVERSDRFRNVLHTCEHLEGLWRTSHQTRSQLVLLPASPQSRRTAEARQRRLQDLIVCTMEFVFSLRAESLFPNFAGHD